MSVPTVSVLLPTYNARPHIESCIEALERQRFDDFEIVVVDDGSTDGTIEYLDGHEDVRLFVRSDPDDGLPGALNYGLERARGTYVARHDADDLSYRDRLGQQVDCLDTHSEVTMVGTAVHLLGPDGTRLSRRIPPANPNLESLLEKNRFVHGSVMFRRDAVLEMGGYDTGFEYAEDYDLWLRLATDHDVRNIQSPLYGLRVHDESIYGAQLRSVKLYGWYARLRVRGETDLTIEEIRKSGIGLVYEELSADQRVAFHTELAQEFLRYDRPENARDACRAALSISRTSPLLWGLFALSYMPDCVVDGVENVYRWMHNRRSHSV